MMKKNTLFLTIFLFLLSSTIYSQENREGKKTGSIGYKMKMHEARHQFLTERNVRVALNKYREILKDYTNDAMVNFRIGECYYALKKFDLSVEYYQNARKINPEVTPELHFNIGTAYHRTGQLEKALKSFETFKSKAKKRHVKAYEVDKMIAQVNYAIKMKSTPVKAEIINLGKNINSRGGDYSPSISADGKTMIFTSRRADTKGGDVDKKGDFKYFEDIYIAEWDSANNKWQKAHPIPGKLNTEGHDASLSISPDGQKIYIYRNDGVAYIGDIFVSKKRKTSGTWGTPKPLDKSINSSYYESSASLSADGNKMYFVSERSTVKNKKAVGSDIFVVEKIAKNTWGEPKKLGPEINTLYDEASVFIHPDGKTLFFSSKGHLSMGGHDIFMSKLQEDGKWSRPENLGYPINTVDDDVHFTLSVDGSTAYYSALKENGLGERDIYKIDMSNYPILNEGVAITLSILKGTVTSGDDNIVADIIFKDEQGKEVSRTSSNDNGDYFITLDGDKTYTISVTAKGYKSFSKKIILPVGKNGKTLIQMQSFKLEKEVE